MSNRLRNEVESWPEGFRDCRKCLQVKPFSEFHKHNGCTFGVNSVCKDCRKPVSSENWKNQSAEYKIWHRAKSRAKEKDIPFNLEISDIIIPRYCPVFAIELIEGDEECTPSIDRLIPDLGYVKGNVRIISNRANRLKADATITELMLIIKYMQKELNCAII